MQYPLSFTFKLLALAPQIYVKDAGGNWVCYVKQKLFKLKENIKVFADDSQTTLLCEISADRVIDWSACYRITDAEGNSLGSVRRQGMKSLWKASYEIADANDQPLATIREENAFVKVLDHLFTRLPFVGVLSGYVFHPKYLVRDAQDQPLMRLTKRPALFEGKFELEKLQEMDSVAELSTIMSLLMMTLLEKRRG